MEDASWTRFARLAWVRGSLVKYVRKGVWMMSVSLGALHGVYMLH
jgi:hypothetical protein